LDQIAPAHFVDSSPTHGDQFARAPAQVLINFDVSLQNNSAITITRDDQPILITTRVIGQYSLTLAATLPADAGDGQYRVKYKACLPDKSCPEGQFIFTVNSNSSSTYVDLTGKSDVTIRMKDIKFSPARIRVSPGAKITWVNDDPIPHFVNSDPHPSHNALPALNSFDLAPDARYAFTFDQPGEWAYHCSAHADAKMIGRVLVEHTNALAQISPTATALIARAQPTLIPTLTLIPTARPTATFTLTPKRQVALDQLPAQIFSAHYVSAEPDHAAILPQMPARIRIEFNFNLHSSSNLAVTQDGKSVDVGKLEIGQFSMQVNPPPNLGAGLYLVKYKACWPDRSCHDGQFAFRVE
ncbi:MAG: copper resistance protein CopC, partial [Chloroflexi bacterium]|nr:copper resistance protein CopC [Chloroflexota bacterium]